MSERTKRRIVATVMAATIPIWLPVVFICYVASKLYEAADSFLTEVIGWRVR